MVVVVEEFIERKSIGYLISASPGEEAEVKIYRVSAGKIFKCERVQIYFPLGTFFELQVVIKRGLEPIKPTKGVYQGDGNPVLDVTGVEFGSDEEIRLWYKNLSTTDIRKAFVLIEGFER